VEANGNAPYGFWRITASGLANLLLLTGAIVGFFLSYDRSISETKSLANQNSKDIAVLAKTVSDINERGTTFSRAGIPLETSAIANLSDRVNQHDKIMGELLPKIERMQATLDFMRDSKRPDH
jgi:hypothetical protein